MSRSLGRHSSRKSSATRSYQYSLCCIVLFVLCVQTMVSESESESEWFIEKGRGPMSIVVTNTVKQL